MAGEEPNRAGGRADSVREASKTGYWSCFVRQSAFAVAVHETVCLPACLSVCLSFCQSVCLSLCQPAFRLKISSPKSKQTTHSRQIASCYLVYLETVALSELTNCTTVINWLRTWNRCRLLLMQPSRLNYRNYTLAS